MLSCLFCTSNATENSYSVFEGPSNPILRLRSGDVTPGIYTEYHNFAPISPKLMIVLRSNFLCPLPGHGVPQQIQNLWNDIEAAMRAGHLSPDAAGSILQNIPIQKSEVIYRHTGNSIPKAHRDDTFIFRCFQLDSNHVSIINNIFLEEAHSTSSIIYHPSSSLRVNLERYFQDRTPGMKHLVPHPLDKRKPYLLTLRKIIHDLGSDTKCHFQPFPRQDIHMSEHVAGEVGIQLLQNKKDENFPLLYSLLKQSTSGCSGNYVSLKYLMAHTELIIYRLSCSNLPRLLVRYGSSGPNHVTED